MNIVLYYPYNMMFTKQGFCGFKTGHVYKISFEDGDQKMGGILGTATYDYTERKKVNLLLPLSSLSSVERYFTRFGE